MTIYALLLVLTSAAFHASWNLLAKQAEDKLTFLWLQMTLAAAVLAVPCLCFVPMPDGRAIPLVLLSGLFQICYYLLLAGTYSSGSVSSVYPLTRGSAPLFVSVLSALLGIEAVTAPRFLAVLVIVAGLYLVNLDGLRREQMLAPFRMLVREPQSRLAFLNGLVIASYTMVDNQTVRFALPLWIYFWICVIPAVLLFPLIRKRGHIRQELKKNGPRAAVVSALTFGAYGLVLVAMKYAGATYVSAVREVSIVFVVIFSRIVLKEKTSPVKVLGAMIIFAGIFALGMAP